MERLTTINEARRANAALLSAALSDDERIVLPRVPEGRTHVWHQYTILLPEDAERDAVVDSMSRDGIECGVYYPRLVWTYEAYRDNPLVRGDATPYAEQAARRCLSLPVHPGLGENELRRVVDSLTAALSAQAAGPARGLGGETS